MDLAVTLGSRRWTALTREDHAWLLAADQSGAMFFNGGYFQALSPQACFYRPGTIGQAQLVRRALMALESSLPECEAAKRIWETVRDAAPLYEFAEEGNHWYIRYRHAFPATADLRASDWIFYFEGDDGWMPIPVSGDQLADALGAMPYLYGRKSVSEQAPPVVKELTLNLAQAGCLQVASGEQATLSDYPGFCFLGHAGLSVNTGTHLLLIDPLIQMRRSHDRSPPLLDLLELADAIALTHNHWDHAHAQTLCTVARNTRMLVPKIQGAATFHNPPLKTWLRELGFTRIEELEPWQSVMVGDIELTAVPFYGEPFGLNSHFDGFTPFVRTPEYSLYGTVDTGCSQFGDQRKVIEAVARRLPPIDMLFLGCSGQTHAPGFIAAGYRYFSNELTARPDLLKYHPCPEDIEPWIGMLSPGIVIPYAEFIINGQEKADLAFQALIAGGIQDTPEQCTENLSAHHQDWLTRFFDAADRQGVKAIYLEPGQGIYF